MSETPAQVHTEQVLEHRWRSSNPVRYAQAIFVEAQHHELLRWAAPQHQSCSSTLHGKQQTSEIQPMLPTTTAPGLPLLSGRWLAQLPAGASNRLSELVLLLILL